MSSGLSALVFVWPRKDLPRHHLQAGPMHFEARHAGNSPMAGQNPGWDRAVEGSRYRWVYKGGLLSGQPG